MRSFVYYSFVLFFFLNKNAVIAMDIGNESYQLGSRIAPTCHTYTQEEVNRIVGQTGLAAYEKINQNWQYADSIPDIKTESKCWKIIYKNFPVYVNNLDFKGEFVGHFYDILEKKCMGECFLARKTVEVVCLIELLGKDNFKRAVEQNENNISAIPELFQTQDKKTSENCTRVKSGSFTAIKNIGAYTYLKKYGSAHSHNVLCVGEDQFIGFDPILFKNGPKNEQGVLENLYEDLINPNYISDRLGKDHESFVANNVPNLQTFIEFRKKEKFAIPAEFYFDVNKINLFLREGNIEVQEQYLSPEEKAIESTLKLLFG